MILSTIVTRAGIEFIRIVVEKMDDIDLETFPNVKRRTKKTATKSFELNPSNKNWELAPILILTVLQVLKVAPPLHTPLLSTNQPTPLAGGLI